MQSRRLLVGFGAVALLTAAPLCATAQTMTKPSADKAAKADANGVKFFEAGARAFEAGKFKAAGESLTAALAGGGLTSPQMAKALYYRGAAYRKQGKAAQAISDLTSAVWLKGGLSDSDRALAMDERRAAYKDAGLGEPVVVGASPLDASAPPSQASVAAANVQTAAVSSGASPPKVLQVEQPSAITATPGGTSASPAAPAPAVAPAASTPASSSNSFFSALSSLNPFNSSGSGPTIVDKTVQPATSLAQAAPPPEAATPVAATPVEPAPPREQATSSWPAATSSSAAETLSVPAPAPVSAVAPKEPEPAASWAPAPVAALEPQGVPTSLSALPQDSSAPPPATSEVAVNTAPPIADVGTAVTSAGNSIGGFFSSLFNGNGGASATAAPSSDVATTSTGPATGASTPASTSSWSAEAPSIQVANAATDAARTSGAAYKVQVGSVRSRADAEQMLAGLRTKHGAVIGAATPAIDEAVIGNMGTFYRVRLGPYASEQEPGKICQSLRPHGYDCMVTR